MELLPAHQQPVHVEVESILVEFGKLRFENMGSLQQPNRLLVYKVRTQAKNSKVRQTTPNTAACVYNIIDLHPRTTDQNPIKNEKILKLDPERLRHPSDRSGDYCRYHLGRTA